MDGAAQRVRAADRAPRACRTSRTCGQYSVGEGMDRRVTVAPEADAPRPTRDPGPGRGRRALARTRRRSPRPSGSAARRSPRLAFVPRHARGLEPRGSTSPPRAPRATACGSLVAAVLPAPAARPSAGLSRRRRLGQRLARPRSLSWPGTTCARWGSSSRARKGGHSSGRRSGRRGAASESRVLPRRATTLTPDAPADTLTLRALSLPLAAGPSPRSSRRAAGSSSSAPPPRPGGRSTRRTSRRQRPGSTSTAGSADVPRGTPAPPGRGFTGNLTVKQRPRRMPA